ncbi:hypothetical protein [Clostridium butyricum]|uniref:hypothetical protein n=1 Tax=Clostridium butyricum TaxID=1492 RepID=UPI002AB29245|nr:hypothetical protein [Clostridium butyricum]
MERVKLSTLSKDTVVWIEGVFHTETVEDILADIDSYRNEEIYTTTEHHASFDAESIIDSAIENEYENGMYEDWDDSIKADITKADIEDLQKIFDRILARNPSSNIAYEADKLIEIDI